MFFFTVTLLDRSSEQSIRAVDRVRKIALTLCRV